MTKIIQERERHCCHRTGSIITACREYAIDGCGARYLLAERLTMEHPEAPAYTDKAPEMRQPRRLA